MSIKGDVEELNKINIEIKRLTGVVKKLRITKKEAEKRIKDYLKEKDLPGVKHLDIVIRLDSKSKNVNKKKSEREKAIFELLSSSGVQNPKEVFERIKNAGKESRSSEILKINNF